MGNIEVKEVLTKKDLRQFIYLPAKIHKDHHDWLPPIYMDEWQLFNKKKNRSFQYTDAILCLAFRDGEPAGRIMGLVNNRYNSIHNEKHGRFCFMECFEDQEVVHALLKHVEEWVLSKGMDKIVGPLGFSDKDPQGFQIEGFDLPYLFTAATNKPYLPKMVESEGYIKEVDLVNFNVPVPDPIPPLYLKAFERASRNGDFEVVEFKSKKEIKPYIISVLELMNETFSEIYGFVPLNDKEKEEFAKRYLPLIDPEFIKVVKTKTKLIGFVVAMPDLSAGIIATKGKLFPFGLFRILKEMKRSKKIMLMLGGVSKDYRGQGIDIMMSVKLLESISRSHMNIIDSHLILETNTRMKAECERLDGKIVKRFRIFQKVF